DPTKLTGLWGGINAFTLTPAKPETRTPLTLPLSPLLRRREREIFPAHLWWQSGCAPHSATGIFAGIFALHLSAVFLSSKLELLTLWERGPAFGCSERASPSAS